MRGLLKFKTILPSKVIRLALLVIIAGATVSCAQPDRTAMRFLDTADHHTYTGIVLLKQEKYDDAAREFTLALQLNAESAIGYAGMSIVRAHKGDFAAASEYIRLSEQYARRDKDRLYINIAKIQIFTMSREPGDWIDRADKEFQRAVATDPRSSAAYYYMGRARMMNHEFQKAGRLFMRALDLNDEYLDQADREWKRVKTIQSARPSTYRVEEAALADRLTRSQAALLLVDEINVEEMYRGLGIYDETARKDEPIRDIEGHRYESEIRLVIDTGVAGLELYPDGTFHPDGLLTRMNLAVAIHDIFSSVTGKSRLTDRYTLQQEIAEEIDYIHPGRDAVKMVIASGIMPPELFISSKLAPYAPISGAEAPMAIINLKDALLIGF